MFFGFHRRGESHIPILVVLVLVLLVQVQNIRTGSSSASSVVAYTRTALLVVRTRTLSSYLVVQALVPVRVLVRVLPPKSLNVVLEYGVLVLSTAQKAIDPWHGTASSGNKKTSLICTFSFQVLRSMRLQAPVLQLYGVRVVSNFRTANNRTRPGYYK
jgi:hypothetical protein